jgi:chromosome segregation ATPase
LQHEHKVVEGRLDAARQEHDRLAERIDALAQRIAGTDRTIEEQRREIAVLERRRADCESREREFVERIAAAERELAGERDAMVSVSEELEMGRAVLARIDQRLSLSRIKG